MRKIMIIDEVPDNNCSVCKFFWAKNCTRFFSSQDNCFTKINNYYPCRSCLDATVKEEKGLTNEK
jgi:hypothetical protein